jgi:integrase/recombinase XerD
MSRIIDPDKTCMHVNAWPEADRTLWLAARANSEFEDDGGSAAHWRPSTAQTYREGYGRWVNFLTRSKVDLATSPNDRVTPELVRAYVASLSEQGLAVQTCCNRVSQLHGVMMALCPDNDWNWLKRRANRMAVIADDHRRTRALSLFTGDILRRTLKALNAYQTVQPEFDLMAAVEYRNWLMMATIALLPLRRRNFAELSVSKSLRRIGKLWSFEVAASDTKQRKTIEMPIPEVLHRHLEYYLTAVRPILLAGRTSDRLWISVRHTPMTSHSIYISTTNFTRATLGTAINPHCFRHIAASTVVAGDPGLVEAARALLTHGETQTTKDHYIIGESLAVGRQHAKLIATLRREARCAGRRNDVHERSEARQSLAQRTWR